MMLIKKYKWAIASILIVLTILGTIHLTSEFKDGKYAKEKLMLSEEYNRELEKRQQEYNSLVEKLNKEALEKQTALANLNSELERKYDERSKELSKVNAKYSNLVSNGWRLRDPGKTSAVQLPNTPENCGSGTTDGGNLASSGRELSREASEFLLSLTYEADQVVEQLKVTQEYAMRLRDTCFSISQ